MTAAKKRNLFEEIREGLEAYCDHRDSLPRRKLSAPDVGATGDTGQNAALATSAKKTKDCRRVG